MKKKGRFGVIIGVLAIGCIIIGLLSIVGAEKQPYEDNNIIYLHSNDGDEKWMNAEMNDTESNADYYDQRYVGSGEVEEYFLEDPLLDHNVSFKPDQNIIVDIHIEITEGNSDDNVQLTLIAGEIILGEGEDDVTDNNVHVEFEPSESEINTTQNLNLTITLSFTVEVRYRIYTDNSSTIDLPIIEEGQPEDKEPPIISNINIIDITEDSATITWTTDEESDSLVENGKTKGYGLEVYDSEMTTTHSIELKDLDDDTNYHFRISSKDENDNTATSDDREFETLNQEEDNEPPTISNIKITEITTDSARITWSTNEASDSYVEYGKTISYGFEVYKSTMTTSHVIILYNLDEDTTYHFKGSSKDKNENNATSEDMSFKTEKKDDEEPPETTPETPYVNVNLELDESDVKKGDEVNIVVRITNSENVSVTVEVIIFDNDEEIKRESEIIEAYQTLDITHTMESKEKGQHSIVAVVNYNGVEIARVSKIITVEEKENDNVWIYIGISIVVIAVVCVAVILWMRGYEYED